MITMNSFTLEPGSLLRDELAAAERVLRSGWYVLGREVQAFEEEWAKTCGAEHAVGVGNGLDAIEIGLRVLGIVPGDEVITTAMTAFASTLAIIRAGATPVFADIDPATALLAPESAERCITPRTKGVLLVHLYGHVHNMQHWKDLCEQHAIHLMEDCAQSHLAAWQGRPGGNFGAWGAYSFYPTKNLGAIGDAGAIITNNEQHAAHARRLRNYGQSQRYQHPETGMNSRLDEMQAALLRVRLKVLNQFTERRRSIAAAYFAGMRNPKVELLAQPVERENHVYHLFVVRCAERNRLFAHLKSQGIESLFHYPIPVHAQEPCKAMARDSGGLQHTERHSAQCVSLPCHPQLTDIDVAAVISAINSFD